MYRSPLAFIFITGLISSLAQAQSCGRTGGTPTDMRVQISLEESNGQTQTGSGVTDDASHRADGGASGQHSTEFSTNLQIRVQLQDGYGSNITEMSPNGEGQVVFHVCSRVTYRVRITSPEFEEATAMDLEPGRGDRIVNMSLHRKGDVAAKKKHAGVVAANRLKIPKGAQKELEKANVALAAGRLPEARAGFEKAIAQYASFDQAYNNLGVVLMQLGEREKGKAAFEKAVSINEHFAHALSNLAKIALDEKQYPKSLELVKRSLAVEPLNPKALLAGAEAAYLAGDYGDSVAFARTLHSLPHEGMGLAHYLCAKSLEKENKRDEAIAEYQIFLNEDPTDPNVPRAQMAIVELKASAATVN